MGLAGRTCTPIFPINVRERESEPKDAPNRGPDRDHDIDDDFGHLDLAVPLWLSVDLLQEASE
jgi:hypothetical protein